MRDLSKSATQADSSHYAPSPDPPLTPRMVISMNAPSPPTRLLPFDRATVSAAGRHTTTVLDLALDLDVMARIAEEAGRDAVRGHADQPPFDTNPTVRADPTTDAMLVAATRLYQACVHGALDPATD